MADLLTRYAITDKPAFGQDRLDGTALVEKDSNTGS